MTNKISKAADGTDVYTKIDARTYSVDGTDCLFFRGGHGSNGRPSAYRPTVNGIPPMPVTVARLVLERKLGRVLLPKMEACHTCDNPACINPLHLWEGTHKQNIADSIAKGRHSCGAKHRAATASTRPRGEKHGSSKLTESQVVGIFGAGGLYRDIAARFGVCPMTISLIKRGKIWAHLNLHKPAATR